MKKSGLVLKNALASAIFVSGLLWVVGFFLIHSSAHATNSSVVDEVTVTVPASCSLNSTVGTAHTATIETGVYTDDIGETTINVFCNDAEGFSIYTVGYTNGEFGNNTMKPGTIAGTNAIATGLATSGDTSNWAMKLTSMSENFTLTNDFGSYHIVPDVYTKVATYPSNTTTTAGVNIKSTYAAYISSVQPADSYNGKVKYVVLHPASKQPVTDISDITYLQDFNTLSSDEKITVYMSMQEGVRYDLIDNRDNKPYRVAKLKDGNIWMGNLDLGRSTIETDLTSDNTNLATPISAETFNSWIKSSVTATYTTPFVISTSSPFDTVTHEYVYGALYNYCSATAGTICSDDTKSSATYDLCPAGWRLPTGGKNGEFKALTSIDDYNTAAKLRAHYSDGGADFYPAGLLSTISTYPTAVGNGGYYWASTNTSSYGYSYADEFYISKDTNFNATSNGTKNFGFSVRCIAKRPAFSLTVTYDEGVSSVTLNGVAVTNGETVVVERDTLYTIGMTPKPRYAINKWSATSGQISNPNLQYTIYTIGKSDGILSVSSTYVETEMQNLNLSSCTTTPLNVYDNRDGSTYTIQQLADGNCWMVDNLNLGYTALTTDLTSSNSNLSTTVAASTFNDWKKTSSTSNYTNGEYISVFGGDPSVGTSYGTLYNYYSASAGTISGTTNENDATNDICPAGWRLPTGGDYGELTNLGKLYDNALFRTPLSNGGLASALAGSFYESNIGNQGYNVRYWSATRNGNTSMYTYYVSTSYSDSSSYERSNGYSIRCVIKRPLRAITISYGTGVSDVIINGRTMPNNTTINVEQGTNLVIDMTPSARYSIGAWSATSGTIADATAKKTNYIVGASDAALSVAAAYVDTAMQNLNSSSCTATPSYVYDNRDGHVYTIKRLLDGNCWMIENLDLGRTDLTTDLTSANTNLSDSVTSQTFNSWRKTTGTATYDAGEFIPLDGTDKKNSMPKGILYNYYAVSAGTISSNTNSDNASYDICPAGWRLPTGGYNGEMRTLYSNYNSLDSLQAPIGENGAAFTFTGYFNYGDPSSYSLENYGYYWTSTRADNTSMGGLYFSSSNYVSDYTSFGRVYGCAIRCVLK